MQNVSTGFRFVVPAVLSMVAQIAAADVSLTLGEQDFADASTPTTGDFLTAGSGESSPFNGVFSGSDVTGPNFSASWTFSYAPQSPVLGASLTLGIYDHESAATGNQVASFKLNGIDLTIELNSLFESRGGASREDNVYVLTLPGTTFASLGTGAAAFELSLQGPGLGIGTNLLRRLQDEATTNRQTIRLHVERENPARHLYRRLGFRETQDKSVYLAMQWTPGQDDRTAEPASGAVP